MLVEASAACDYAQKRRRLPRYIVALEVPEKYQRYIEHSQDGFRMRTRHEALVQSPIFRIGDSTMLLMFHLRMVVSPLPEWAKFPPVFRIRGQLLDQVIQRLSFHEARLGVVELPPGEGPTKSTAAANPTDVAVDPKSRT